MKLPQLVISSIDSIPKTIQVSAAGQLLQQLNGFVYGRNVVCIAMADKNARCLLFLQKSHCIGEVRPAVCFWIGKRFVARHQYQWRAVCSQHIPQNSSGIRQGIRTMQQNPSVTSFFPNPLSHMIHQQGKRFAGHLLTEQAKWFRGDDGDSI